MAKSIVDIDVNDGKFQAFLGLWNKYQTSLSKTPDLWKKAGSGAAALGSANAAGAKGLEKQSKSLDKQKGQYESINKAMAGMAKSAERVAKFMASTAMSVLKFVGEGGILSGLMGAGGLWGLDRLAGSVSNNYRTAQGLGTTSGRLKAFQLNFGQYLPNAQGNIENVASAQADYSRRWAFNAMGVKQDGKDPAVLAAEMAVKAKALFDKSDKSEQFARSRGLLEFYSMDDLRALHNTPMKDLEAAKKNFGADARSLSLTKDQQAAWQELNRKLATAGQKIEVAFINGLQPLVNSKAFEKLSTSIVDFITKIAGSKELQEWITKLATAISGFGDYLLSPKFNTDLKTFVTNFTAIMQAISDWLIKMHILPGSDTRTAKELNQDINSGTENGDLKKSYDEAGGITSKEMAAMRVFTKSGYSKEQAAGLVSNLERESEINPFASGDPNAFGVNTAYGIGQWHKDRRAVYAQLFHHRMQDVKDPGQALSEQEAFVLYELRKGARKFAGDHLNKIKGAYEAGDYVSRRFESPGTTEQAKTSAAKSRGHLATIIVKTYNTTGGNSHTGVTQAAAQ
jgi:hypothetical protein